MIALHSWNTSVARYLPRSLESRLLIARGIMCSRWTKSWDSSRIGREWKRSVPHIYSSIERCTIVLVQWSPTSCYSRQLSRLHQPPLLLQIAPSWFPTWLVNLFDPVSSRKGVCYDSRPVHDPFPWLANAIDRVKCIDLIVLTKLAFHFIRHFDFNHSYKVWIYSKMVFRRIFCIHASR